MHIIKHVQTLHFTSYLLLAEDSLDAARADDTKQRLPGGTAKTTATETSPQRRTTGEPDIAIASNSSESSQAATRRCLVRQVLPRQSGRLGAGVGPDRHGQLDQPAGHGRLLDGGGHPHRCVGRAGFPASK